MADPDQINAYRLIVRDLATDVVAIVAGAVGVGALLLGHRTPGLALLVVTVLAVAARQLWRSREPSSSGWQLGLVLLPRTFLAVGVAIALAPPPVESPSDGFAAGLGAALLVAVLASEPLLRRAANHRVRFVAHLPGVPADPPARDLVTPTIIANLG